MKLYDIAGATPELFSALSKAQGEIENASKNAANPHFKSKYADLAEVLNTIRPVFAKHGLSIVQATGFDGVHVHVTTILAHSGGGNIITTASCQPAKTDAQGVGSATTYLRRYSAAAVAGIAQEDDDGNASAHDRKPSNVTRADEARYNDFKAAIEAATDETELTRIGKELSGSGLPASLLSDLRAIFSEQKKAVAA